MPRILFAILVVLFLVPTLRAQDDLAGKISCHCAGFPEPQNQPYAKKLWDGYGISLGPARNGGVDGNGRTAALYNSGGHVVFRTSLLSFSESTPTNRPPQKIWLSDLSTDETFLRAKLTAAEQKQIIDQVENTSFDVPDSWEAELSVRRVSLGNSDGLIIRGTQLLCGGTGNCQTWVFRRSAGKWLNMFEQKAPIVSGFAFQPEATRGIKDFLVSANRSVGKETLTLFKFDGKVYQQGKCYDVSVDNAQARKIEVPCK